MLRKTKRLIDSTLKHLPAITEGLAFLSGLIECFTTPPKPQPRLTAKSVNPPAPAKRTRKRRK
jgi:hypothetical protein